MEQYSEGGRWHRKGYFRNIIVQKLCNKIEKSLQTVFNDITRMSATFQRHRIYTDADERAFKLFDSLGS